MSKDQAPAFKQERGEDVSRLKGSLRRLENRVRRWSNDRWFAQAADGRSGAEVAYELAVILAQLARRAGNGAPPMAPAPVAPHGLADQLAVLGRELVDAPEAAAYAKAGAAAVERASTAL